MRVERKVFFCSAALETQSKLSSLSSPRHNTHRPKPFLLNLLTGGGDHNASLNREQEKKERRRQRRRGEEEEEQRQLRSEEKSKTTTTTTTTTSSPPPPPPSSLSSPSLLAPCPVCGTLFRRGLDLDAHVAAEVAAGLLDEEEGGAQARAAPPQPSPLRVLLPAAATLPRGGKRASSSSSSAAVFELSDARAEVSLFKKSTREKAELGNQHESNRQRQQQGRRLPPLPRVLRLPQLERRFNHFADGSGAWGDETLGIDGASGAQAWQARGVSGIGDPFRGASGGAAGE